MHRPWSRRMAWLSMIGTPNHLFHRRHRMQRRLLAVVLSLTSVCAPIAIVSAQTAIGLSAGIAAPMSDLGDAADLGYNIAAGLNFGGTRLPIGARIEGAL